MTGASDFTIAAIERIRVDVPFHERCADRMTVRGNGWSVSDIYRVELACGAVGVGETIVGYTWGASAEARVEASRGRSVFDLLWDDGLGAGLQMACFDAAGRAAGVPCHRLMGPQYRDACPVSWWSQDAKPEEWVAEARAAEAGGFTTMKVKARPWHDLDAQLAAVAAAVSPHFKLDADFNEMLLGVDVAAPFIARLEAKYPMLAMVESPIPQGDVAGNAALRRQIRSPIAMHFGNPPPMTAIREGVCDGFVIGGGASQVMSHGTLAAHAGMPFWLQMVGTGLTTMFSVHLGAVLAQARWPAIPCINIYSHTLLKEFSVEGGHVAVPDGPGLGVEVDWDVVEGFRVDPDYRKADPRQIHTIHWPDGRRTRYPGGGYRGDFTAGRLPPFLPGISLDYRLDDGSEEFNREYRDLFG